MDDTLITRLLSDTSPCLLCVCEDSRCLRKAAEDLALHTSWPILDVGMRLSGVLLGVHPAQRTAKAREALGDLIRLYGTGPVICNGIDLLFLPELALDPLALFLEASRHTRLVVLWPGRFQKNDLSYAVSGHKHYRHWEVKNLSVYLLERR